MANFGPISSNNGRGDTSKLEEKISREYKIAISYYQQKKMSLIKQITNYEKNKQMSQTELEEKVNDFLTEQFNIGSKYWDKIDDYLYIKGEENAPNITVGEKAYNKFNKLVDTREGFSLKEKRRKVEFSEEELTYISEIYKADTNKTIQQSFFKQNEDSEYVNNILASLSGQFGEPFIAGVIRKAADVGSDLLTKKYQELFSQAIPTGQMRSSIETATKGANKQLSADIGIGINESNKNYAEVSVRESLNINAVKQSFSQANPEHVGSLIFQMMNINQRDQMFGFSLKRWKDGQQDKQYTTSEKMKHNINNLFFNGEDGKDDGNKTWNAKYAFASAQLELAKEAISLLGAVNVGVITTKGFTWMDEFIENKRFYMNVYSYNKSPRRQEILPYINSSNIYLHTYNDRDKVGYSQWGKERGKPYYIISYQSRIEDNK